MKNILLIGVIVKKLLYIMNTYNIIYSSVMVTSSNVNSRVGLHSEGQKGSGHWWSIAKRERSLMKHRKKGAVIDEAYGNIELSKERPMYRTIWANVYSLYSYVFFEMCIKSVFTKPLYLLVKTFVSLKLNDYHKTLLCLRYFLYKNKSTFVYWKYF